QSVRNEVDEQRARELNFSVVRRITGGGAMFVEPGNTITYSLYVPADFLQDVRGSEAYKRCDEWALLALNKLGINARYKPINDITSPAGKIGGAAQRLVRGSTGCVLHHVTMAYDIDAVRMMQVLRISREKLADKAVQSAAKRVDPLKSQTSLSRDELCSALQSEALEMLPSAHLSELDEVTLEQARQLAREKFESFAWTHAIA
ncbi:lipoate--protein ligase family protein, partial [Alloscardovia omnicolens]